MKYSFLSKQVRPVETLLVIKHHQRSSFSSPRTDPPHTLGRPTNDLATRCDTWTLPLESRKDSEGIFGQFVEVRKRNRENSGSPRFNPEHVDVPRKDTLVIRVKLYTPTHLICNTRTSSKHPDPSLTQFINILIVRRHKNTRPFFSKAVPNSQV